MLRHILIAAWRNMMANRLISAIAILGLSVGIAAALLMALVVRAQTSFDRFIPGHERTYAVLSSMTVPERGTFHNTLTTADTAQVFQLNVPGIEAITRLMASDMTANNPASDGTMTLSSGAVTGRETFYWAEPSLAAVLPLPVFRGDLKAALARPDGIVVSRGIARKYFGRDDVVGAQLLLNRHPMTVGAVIQDLPADQTELEHDIFASSLASFSGFAVKDGKGNFNTNVHTYLRLKPGAALTGVEGLLPGLVPRLAALRGIDPHADHFTYVLSLQTLSHLNLDDRLYPGARTRLAVEALIGLLILFIAAVNFVNLLTARAARRAREVGVRKVCGADRAHLMAQFLGEAILAVALAACMAAGLSEWALPALNAFLRTNAVFAAGGEMLVGLLLGVTLLGLAAGAWPALVLSAFRPVKTLKDGMGAADGGKPLRLVLTGLQFAILIVLAIATIVVWQQRLYATSQGLRANTDQMLVVQNANCTAALRAEIRKLAGVEGAACANGRLLDNGQMTGVSRRGAPMQIDLIEVDWGAFGLYGVKPLAGTLPAINAEGDSDPANLSRIVLNARAVQRLGFASPQAAIGQRTAVTQKGFPPTSIVAAVVPDFAFYSVERPLEPTLYRPMSPKPTAQQLMQQLDRDGDGAVAGAELTEGALKEADTDHDGRVDLGELTALIDSSGNDLINIRLRGNAIPETLAAIDRLWAAAGIRKPIDRFFLQAHMQALYLDMARQAQMLGLFSGIAVLLACLGLIGIAVSTAERRTKEIGVRKAMGARDREIVALLLWQFAQPVLWANVIAWPVAWWLMHRWLSGFAYHIDLHWWVFAGASLGALAIALATVAGQAILTARRKPVLALRYE